MVGKGFQPRHPGAAAADSVVLADLVCRAPAGGVGGRRAMAPTGFDRGPLAGAGGPLVAMDIEAGHRLVAPSERQSGLDEPVAQAADADKSFGASCGYRGSRGPVATLCRCRSRAAPHPLRLAGANRLARALFRPVPVPVAVVCLHRRAGLGQDHGPGECRPHVPAGAAIGQERDPGPGRHPQLRLVVHQRGGADRYRRALHHAREQRSRGQGRMAGLHEPAQALSPAPAAQRRAADAVRFRPAADERGRAPGPCRHAAPTPG